MIVGVVRWCCKCIVVVVIPAVRLWGTQKVMFFRIGVVEESNGDSIGVFPIAVVNHMGGSGFVFLVTPATPASAIRGRTLALMPAVRASG